MRPIAPLLACLALVTALPAGAVDAPPTSGRAAPAYQQVRERPPPAPLLVPDICPLSDCIFGPWTASAALTAYAREGQASRVSFRLRPGERFTALTGNLHVQRPAKLRVAETFVWPPFSQNPFERYTRGSVLWVLAPRGDRWLDVWYRGRRRGIRAAVGRGAWYMPGRDQLQELEPGIWTWWVKVQRADRRQGWLMFPDIRVAGIRELAR